MKALIIIAHPDDHVLWMGGTILRFKNWAWHILSLCNSHNNNFQQKLETFNTSCMELEIKRYQAKVMKDYQQAELMEIDQPLKMQKEILAFAEKEYDLIFTHSTNPKCEYGFHANHAEAKESVNLLVGNGQLKTKVIFYFCYKEQGGGLPVIAELTIADYRVELTDDEITKKRKLKESFTWAEGDFRALALWHNDEPKVEAFNVRRFADTQLPSDFVICKR